MGTEGFVKSETTTKIHAAMNSEALKYIMLCLSIFAGVLTVFHSVEDKLVKANTDYQARIVELSRRKRENAMRIKQSGSRYVRLQLQQVRSPTMRKLSFFNGQPDVDHEGDNNVMSFLNRLNEMRQSKEASAKTERRTLIEKEVRGIEVLEDNL